MQPHAGDRIDGLGPMPSGSRWRPAPAGPRRIIPALAALVVLASSAVPVPWARALSSDLEKALRESTYVYIATKRKNGTFGKPSEIWFMYHDGAVWVASPTTTWRARRIKANRPKARIAVGKPDGPTFKAKGSVVKDTALYDELYRTFARKYPDGWPKYEQQFRKGLADGSRVLIKYTPVK
jgi:hypothetical protein